MQNFKTENSATDFVINKSPDHVHAVCYELDGFHSRFDNVMPIFLHSGSKGKSLAKFVKFAMSFSVAKSGNQSLAKSLLSAVLNWAFSSFQEREWPYRGSPNPGSTSETNKTNVSACYKADPG